MSITTVVGSVVEPEVHDFPARQAVVIPHCCNNIGKFGAGVAEAIRRKYPKAAQAHSRLCRHWANGPGLLGQSQLVLVERGEKHSTIVANMFGQLGVRSKSNKQPLDYGALKKAMISVRDDMFNSEYEHFTFHCPQFGCGLAGGRWEKVEEMINSIWCQQGIRVFVYIYK